MGIPRQPTRIERGLWCKWDRSIPGWFKLNKDGSARGELTAGGGIIRDSDGELIVSFSSFYGIGTNNSPEFLALKEGMALCKALQLSPVLIECDSMLVVAAIRFEKMDNWRLLYVFRECHKLYSSNFEIVHGFRQKNLVAHRLADLAYTHRSRLEFYQNSDLPRSVRNAFISDKLGLWCFRP